MPALSVHFPGAQNSGRQILLASKMSCSFLLLDLEKSRLGCLLHCQKFSTQMADFELVFETVYGNLLNMAHTTHPLGGIWIKKITTGENCGNVMVYFLVFFLKKKEGDLKIWEEKTGWEVCK